MSDDTPRSLAIALSKAQMRIAELERQLARTEEALRNGDLENVSEVLTQLSATQMRLHEAEAELDALRPWAEVGKRAVEHRWYSDEFGYSCCRQEDYVHTPDCEVLSLEAQLEADNATKSI